MAAQYFCFFGIVLRGGVAVESGLARGEGRDVFFPRKKLVSEKFRYLLSKTVLDRISVHAAGSFGDPLVCCLSLYRLA